MKRTILFLLSCLLVSAAAAAQVEYKREDIEKQQQTFKLATKPGKDGKLEWDKFPPHNCAACKATKKEECTHCKHLEDAKLQQCPECKKTRKADCHHCVGQGKLPDPLEFAPCPGCNGHKHFFCFLCANRGRIYITGGTDKGQKCPSCKGESCIPCTACKGKGLVQSAMRGKVGSADLKKLQKAKQTVNDLFVAIQRFRAGGSARTDHKKFDDLLKNARADLPPLKDLSGMVKNILKGVDKPQFKDNDQGIIRTFDQIRLFTLYYLLHEERVIDQCIARAEQNEGGAKK